MELYPEELILVHKNLANLSYSGKITHMVGFCERDFALCASLGGLWNDSHTDLFRKEQLHFSILLLLISLDQTQSKQGG